MSGQPARTLAEETGVVEALTHDGRGIIRGPGKTVFVDGALPGEEVRFTRVRKRRNHDQADLLELIQRSPERVDPRCQYFGACGGCVLQHLAPEAQRRFKQATLLETLERIGGVAPERVLPPVTGSEWHYRRRARLAVKDVAGKGRVLVGFRERRGTYVADMLSCEVLEPPVHRLLGALSDLIGTLSIRRRLPQVEVAVTEQETALVFRVLDPPTPGDIERLTAFGRQHGLAILCQPGGPESVYRLDAESAELVDRMPEFDLELGLKPTDFLQINAEVNRRMIRQALVLLEIKQGDAVLDLFCGLGNLTLPLARYADRVVGIDGDQALISRARANARRNGLGNVTFHSSDLTAQWLETLWARGNYDKLVIDPPRSGAASIVTDLHHLGVSRVLYISCYPATLARDAGTLVHGQGYRLRVAGIVDMFPHTAHVESMALFERG